MNENIAKKVCYIDTHIEMEDGPEKRQLKAGEVPVIIDTRNIYSGIGDEYRFRKTEHKNGGLVRQPVKDGGGHTHFEWVFSGGARRYETPAFGEMSTPTIIHAAVPHPGLKPDFSFHRESNPNPVWSLGTNTLNIEAKLRKHKVELDYKEPERRGGVRHKRVI